MSAIQSLSSDKPKIITPADGVKLTYNGEAAKTRYISVGTAGILSIKDSEGVTVEIPANNLEIGKLHAISTDEILATNTTAASIVAYF